MSAFLSSAGADANLSLISADRRDLDNHYTSDQRYRLDYSWPVEINDQIRKIPLSDWDPIGIKDEPRAHAEYERYIPEIKKLLLSGITETKLTTYLELLSVDQMGMASNVAESTVVARKLLGLIRSK